MGRQGPPEGILDYEGKRECVILIIPVSSSWWESKGVLFACKWAVGKIPKSTQHNKEVLAQKGL
jgi:hypothetical protein